MAIPGPFLRIPGEVCWRWMLEPRKRTNWSHKQRVAAFLNTAAFFSGKLKIARPLQAGFTLSLLPHPFVCFIQGFCMSMTPWYYFRQKVCWRNVSFLSTMFTPDVPNCPIVFHVRGTHGNLPASLPSPSASPIFGKINTIYIVSKNLQLIGFFFFKEMFITCVICYG